jgi:DNA-binding NarL/FixJ family response regulator
MDESQIRFLAAVQDIFFATKIADSAKRVGVKMEFIKDETKLREAAESSQSVVILDLNNAVFPSIEVARKLKAGPTAQSVQIIAYLSHVQTDLMREAQKAGCDLVLPRSVFSQQLDDLLRQRSCHL